MNKKQESRSNVYNAVARVLREHEAETTGAVALLAARDEFEVNLLAIKSCVERQVVDITGYAQAKALMVERMVGVALVVAKGTLAYAEVVGDRVLAGKMKVGRKALIQHPDGVVARHCKSILDAATPVAAQLVGYGVDAARLTSLQQAIDRYDEALSAPRLAITTRKGATSELALLMTDTAKLLAKRLDGLMERYRLEAPSFHRAYMDARIVVDRGVRTPREPLEKAA